MFNSGANNPPPKRSTSQRRSIFDNPNVKKNVSFGLNMDSLGQSGNDDPPTPVLLQQDFDPLNSKFLGGNPIHDDLQPVVDEIPLLEELGINFRDIFRKSMFVLNPISKVKKSIFNDEHFIAQSQQQHNPELEVLRDGDLCGPLVFCLLLGFLLLFRGRFHFGTIYGVGTIGTISIYILLNLMSRQGIKFQTIISILGYGLLPMVSLAAVRLFQPMISSYISSGYITSGWILNIYTFLVVLWSTWSATSMIVYSMSMIHQKYVIAYPILLIYVAFSLVILHG